MYKKFNWMTQKIVTQMKIRAVNSFLVDPTLAKHFSIYVKKQVIFIIHGDDSCA